MRSQNCATSSDSQVGAAGADAEVDVVALQRMRVPAPSTARALLLRTAGAAGLAFQVGGLVW